MHVAQVNTTPQEEFVPEVEPALADHEKAVRAVLEGSSWDRVRIGTSALLRLLRDPNDTNQVLLLGISTSRQTFPKTLARFCLNDEGVYLLKHQPCIDSRTVEKLRNLPSHTLGGAYVDYLDREDLSPDLFQPTPALPEIPRYVSQRVRQTHDLWHVVTGYRTDVAGELALQAFTYAQIGAKAPALVVGGGLARWGARNPKLFPLVREGYRMGKRTTFLAPIRWELRWERPLEDVRRELGVVPTRLQ